jgi:hypothetical protein
MLVPAAVLVVVILGAIAVDSAVAFLGQREIANAAAAGANDAATAAISDTRFYRGGDGHAPGALVLDLARARAVAGRAVAARAPRGVHLDAIDVSVAGDRVCVTVRARVPFVFARALPMVGHHAAVTGQATAIAVSGDPGTAPPSHRPAC